ncbi:hypothetical protein EW093_17140 (plasmid) [Thiospirochaeta perfilievii]|uniref:Rad50/SbcC-type AAA domain-containing protein n=1 Tax=Thiospirochaeta perfilievii TaxID=252967 RepID=A0A5C1QEE3_9SPIO|nr:ATP-binding protein [Thiospirochaeta perfilievii]QEN06433.1 hypothetical protein EW093_17140 [Thiospirochaeta perfilievii]
MRYYVVRALWGDTDKSEDFVKEGIWENGYGEEKYSLTVSSITPGDILILARPGREIFNVGICTRNENDFKKVIVNWFEGFVAVDAGKAISPYMRTINKLGSDDFWTGIKSKLYSVNPDLEQFLQNLDDIDQIENTRINNISLGWFKFFGEKTTFNLSGKNMLLYGENGSGKTSFSDAIRFIANTSIEPNTSVEYYKNIFAGDTDEFHVGIELSNNDEFIVDSVESIQPHTVLQHLAFINPFITYKDIIQIYFREIEQEGTRNLYHFFKVILDDYPVGTDSRITRLADLSGIEYFNKLTELVLGLKELANQFLEEFKEDIFIEDFKADSFDKKITLELTFKDKDVPEYQTFLNEAKLTALGLSVFFAAIVQKYSVYDTECKILVLDDLLVSLDMGHRMAVLDIVTKNHFEHYQKIILTHERGFFNLFKSQLNSKEWAFYEMYEKANDEKGCSFPYVLPSLDFLTKAKIALDEKDFDCCANLLRKETEKICTDYLVNINKKNGQPMSLEELLGNLKRCLKNDNTISSDLKRDITKIVDEILLFKRFILNPFSHANSNSPLYKKELTEAMEIITGFKTAIENV